MKNIKLENEFGYTQDQKVFIKGYSTYPDRQIGEVRNTDQEALDYFVNRFALAVSTSQSTYTFGIISKEESSHLKPRCATASLTV